MKFIWEVVLIGDYLSFHFRKFISKFRGVIRVQIFEANLGFSGFDGLYLGNGLSYGSETWWIKRYPYNLHCL